MIFTTPHKSQDAWETLTQALIEKGWIISSSFPVESEFANSQHLMGNLSAASSIFITCRKRKIETTEPAAWVGFGGTGVQQRIQTEVAQALEEFKPLRLNPVDEMVACYGRALRVLSEQWPVFDGDDRVSPVMAMNEASRVVAENQISRITDGSLKVADLSPEAAMSLTIFGIYGLNELPFDEALNLSRSLKIRLETKTGGYRVVEDGKAPFIGINTMAGGRARNITSDDNGFYAPLIRKGSKLRLAKPEERNPKRLAAPQTEWDVLQGMIMAYRDGDMPVARGYLEKHAELRKSVIRDMLAVWAAENPDESLRKEGQAILFGWK